jgi:glycosyltransferase involved in cell wall biosynthesis
VSGWRPGSAPPVGVRVPGVRVILDVRPIQDPERAPLTAIYLESLLDALDADPIDGESFAFLVGAERQDPTSRWARLHVVGRRLLPPTRMLRSGALTVDPLLLRGASVGAGWRAEDGGAAGSVYHAAAGSLPIASRIPVVAALLDLAPWAMPEAYQRGTAARFGQRLRARLLKDARIVLVPSRAARDETRRLLRIRRDRLRVVALAPRPAFRSTAAGDGDEERGRLGLTGRRYAVYAGRFDARQDLPTLLAALGILAAESAPPGVDLADWPPRVCVVGASPDDRASLSRSALGEGVTASIVYAPGLPDAKLAGLVAGARVALQPAHSDATGLGAIEAIAAGVPVIASAVGTLAEVVGRAGILVEPGDPSRLAAAIRTAWTDAGPYPALAAAARERGTKMRTWADVATETRAAWAEAAGPAPLV